MNYSESHEIKREISKATKILINCHKKPDVDSVASALALKQALVSIGKNPTIVCPDSPPAVASYLDGFSEIEIVYFSTFDFSLFDLFLVLDTADWERTTGNSNLPIPNIKKIIIDHHRDNSRMGEVNLIDESAGSTSELLYLLFGDLGIDINEKIGEALVTGMAGDSSGFRNTGASARTFRIVSELMEKGVDKSQIITNIYGTMSLNSLGFLGEVLTLLKVDVEHKFAWAAVPYEVFSQYSDSSALELYSGTFLRSVQETEFGVMFLEKEKGKIDMSIKSRSDYDVSKIAKALGGGGHKRAGGGTILLQSFSEKIDEMLTTIRQLA